MKDENKFEGQIDPSKLRTEIYKKQKENADAKAAGLKEPHNSKIIEEMWQLHNGTKPSQNQSPNSSAEMRFASSFEKSDFKRLTENEATKWTGTHWQTVAPFELKSLAYEWLKKNAEGEAKKSKADSCATCVLYELEKIEAAASNHIPFTNSYLEIHETEIDFGFKYRAPDRLSNLQYCIPTELNMSAADAVYYVPEPVPQESLFAKFLNVSLPDQGTQKILQEFIGSTLLADTRYQTAAFFIGEGRNGKGVMMRLAKALHRQTAAMLLNKLEDFGLQGLVGASLALVDEAPKSGVNEQVLKSLIAGESVMAHDPANFCTNCKMDHLSKPHPKIH
jgi:putative DNA primase/helicase